MKRGRPRSNRARVTAIIAAGVVLAGGTYAFASGLVAGSPAALFAAVVAAFSGKPAIMITKDPSSASGVTTTGGNRTLATFDVSAKNVTYWGTLRSLSVDIDLSGGSADTLDLSQFSVGYQYCIRAGVTYGYGYKGGSCSSRPLTIASATRSGNTYHLVLYGGLAIYPQQSSGMLTISARPAYRVGGTANDSAHLQVRIVGGSASGDQCKAYSAVDYAKLGYGYSQCTAFAASVNGVSGNALRVNRSYGYGYCLI